MELGDYISIYRKEAGLTIDELALRSGVPKGTINKIIAGTTKSPTLETVQNIASALGKTISDFTEPTIKTKKPPLKKDEADEIAEQFRALDEHGRGAVRSILNFEHAAVIAEKRQSGSKKPTGQEPKKKRSDGFIEVTVYDQPAAAGLGNYLDNPASHIEQYPANMVPDDTDFGIRISGRSMEPNIPDGSTAFVHAQLSIQPGQIGIFRVNGEALCKKLVVDRERGQVRLVSFNKVEFPEDRIIEECDEFQTMALVLGWYPK